MSIGIFEVLKVIEDNKIEVIELNMFDISGRPITAAIPARVFTPEFIRKGITIDTVKNAVVAEGSGDAIFIPDLDTATVKPFAVSPTLSVSGTLERKGTAPVVNAAPQSAPNNVSKGDRITSLIFSIVALSCGGCGALCATVAIIAACGCWWLYGAGIIVGIAWGICTVLIGTGGIVFGVLGKKKCAVSGRSTGMATAGFWLGIASVASLLIPIVLAIICAIMVVCLVLIFVALFIILYIIILLFYCFIMCFAACLVA